MISEFAQRTYEFVRTAGGCFCMLPSALAAECRVAGQGVLDQYNPGGIWGEEYWHHEDHCGILDCYFGGGVVEEVRCEDAFVF